MSLFGDRLRECRENRGIKREELATRLGISRNTLGRWERGERWPRSLEMVYELANILGVPVLYLSDVDEERQEEELKKNSVIQDLEERLARLEHSLGRGEYSFLKKLTIGYSWLIRNFIHKERRNQHAYHRLSQLEGWGRKNIHCHQHGLCLG